MNKAELILKWEKEIEILQQDFIKAVNDRDRLHLVSRRNAISEVIRDIKNLNEETRKDEDKIKFTILSKEQVISDRSNANDYLL